MSGEASNLDAYLPSVILPNFKGLLMAIKTIVPFSEKNTIKDALWFWKPKGNKALESELVDMKLKHKEKKNSKKYSKVKSNRKRDKKSDTKSTQNLAENFEKIGEPTYRLSPNLKEGMISIQFMMFE